MKRVIPDGFLSVLAFAFFHIHIGYGAIVTVSNPNFEQPGNAGSITGIVGTVNQQLGSGPWSASSSGAIGLLGPSLAIVPGAPGGNDGVATISGLGSVNVGTLIANTGEFFQFLAGVSFQANTPYRLSVDITSSSALSLGSLTNSGIGLGAGTVLVPGMFKSTTAPVGTVTFVSAGMSGRLTFEVTTPAVVLPGDVRLRLYRGEIDGIANVSILPNVTFDNVLFEIIPEPSSAALSFLGCLGLASRRRHRK